MKKVTQKLPLVAAAVLLLSGSACTEYIIKPDIVHVDKPVLSCPSLEALDFTQIDLETLKLNEKSSDGEVARAYNIDMHVLTQRVSEYNRLVDEFKAAQVKMKEAQAKIDQIFKENNDKVLEEVLRKQKEINANK